jgi:predicted RNase H-like HicB family nuclease
MGKVSLSTRNPKTKKMKRELVMKPAKEYLKEPYSRVLVPESDGTYSADILEFPGCFAEGKSPNEAYANLEKTAEAWIEAALEQGQEIPAPIEAHNFSGRNALRIPRSIHKQAAKFAKMDDTSLNQFFLTAIATRVGAEDFVERLSNRLEAKCAAFATAVPSYTVILNTALWAIGSVNVTTTQEYPPELWEKIPFSFDPGELQLAVPSGQFLLTGEDVKNG